MVVFPKAKINLGLLITGKRPDGFHNIESIIYPVDLSDALEVVANTEGSETDVLTVTGNELPGRAEDNLVIKAVDKLRETHSFPFLKIHLHKKIPPGAGLGGGSSDAASILRLINRTYNLLPDPDVLKKIAGNIGSDCPFFIDSRPAFASGRGDVLRPLVSFLGGLHILLLNPGIQISTREAYADCEPQSPLIRLPEVVTRPIAEWKELIINDFEKTIFKKYPLIGSIKQALYNAGALYCSMSGSGSVVYGIFRDEPVVPEDLKEHVIYTGEL
jgi:4-diphosphocytidyl-2-C-methyl-D-erythritol kinase